MTKRAYRRRETDNMLKLVQNEDAVKNGPQKRKTFSQMDMHDIVPLTKNQETVFELFDAEPDTGFILEGCPGTGKTFLALYLSLKIILDKSTPFKRLVIIRSTVPTRNMGFLPGEESVKFAPYERPYIALFDSIFKMKKSYENMKEIGLVQFESTAFLRGNTYDDAIVLFDEFQNSTYEEFSTVASRIGTNSKFVVSGDTHQSDLQKQAELSGNQKFLNVMKHMDSNDYVRFEPEDIVRSGYVKDLILTQIRLGYL